MTITRTQRQIAAFLTIAVLLLLSPWNAAPAAPTADVFWTGTPRQNLLTHADKVTVTATATTISRDVPLRERNEDLYLVMVPDGEIAARIDRIILRELQTGDSLDPSAIEDNHSREMLNQALDRRVSVDPFGHFRGVRAARLSVDCERPVPFGEASYEIASYTVSVTYPQVPSHDAAGDTAWEKDAMYRRMLEEAFVNAPALDRFVAPMPQNPYSGPAAWQPRPELSPDFPWLKIPISKDGIYVIDGRWVSDAGLDPNELDPDSLYIVRAGEVVPIELAGPRGAGFSGGERVLFYGLGSMSEETTDNVYYLGKRPGAVIPPAFRRGPAFDESLPVLNDFVRHRTAEQDNDRETSFGAFLSIQDMRWVWTPLHYDEVTAIDFDLPGIVLDDGDRPTTCSINLYFPSADLVKDADLEILDGEDTLLRKQLDPRVGAQTFGIPAGKLKGKGNKLTARLVRHQENSKSEAPKVFLDSLTNVYTSQFALDDGQLDVQFQDALTVPNGLHLLRLAGTRPQQLLAFDLTDPTVPELLNVEARNDTLYICADVALDRRVLLQERDRIERAPAPQATRWVDWSHNDHSADILILHHPLFEEGARKLAGVLNGAGYEALPVDVVSVYENYSGGDLSADAIRAFISTAVHSWTGRRPQAAILIGDSTSDGRNRSRDNVPNYMPIPLTVPEDGNEEHAFSSDSLYAWLTGGDEAADIIMARLSTAQPEDLAAFISNDIAYRQDATHPAPWTNRLLAVSDTGQFHQALDETVRSSLGNQYVYTLLAADDFAWEDNYYLPDHLITREEDSKVSPLLTAAIENGLNQGAAVVTFFGHGAPNLWSNQRFWFGGGTPNSDIIRLENKGKLPLVTSFTCNNAVVDYPLRPWNICIAEDFMSHEGKGAIGAFMPSGPGYLTNHEIMARGFIKAWSQLDVHQMGALAELARLYHQIENPGDIHSRMFLFLGDPTLMLPPPPSGVDEPHPDPKLPESDGDVLIDESYRLTGDAVSSRQAAWRLVLGNRTPLNRDVTLQSSLINGEGEILQHSAFELKLGPNESQAKTVTFDLPAVGGYHVVFDLPGQHGQWVVDRLPSRRVTDYLIVPDGSSEPGLVIAPSTLTLVDPGSASLDASIRFQVSNLGTAPTSGRVNGTLRFGGGESPATFESPVGLIQSGRSILFTQRFRAPREWKSPATFDVTLTGRIDDQNTSATTTQQWTLTPEELPDVAIDEKSIELSPLPLSDGLTVFVHAVIENCGGRMSSECRTALFAEEDKELKSPLRDITGNDFIRVPALLPGERRSVRLRWDPTRNAGEYSIRLAVDYPGGLIESNKQNNSVLIPMKVRTKSQLKPGDLLVGKGKEPGELVLVAKVTNHGETDARRVTVNFYKLPEQTPANKICEVLLDRVPAGATLEAPLLWKVDVDHDDLSKLKPTFTVSLKGSLMRISSVAEDARNDGSEPAP